MRFWKLTRCPCGSRGAIAAEWRKMSSASRVWNGLRQCRYGSSSRFCCSRWRRHRPFNPSAFHSMRPRSISPRPWRTMARRATGCRSRPRRASDGIVRRIEVSALEPGSQPNWIVFALTNDTDEQIERLVVAPHFRLVGSGVIWPDLGASRISAITASQGFPPEREDSADADVFRLTLDPGTTVTYVAELRTPNLPQLYLWEPDAYKDKVDEPDTLQGHRHRRRGPAGALPHHRLRRQGRGDLSRRRGAGLGGARLCLHRLRLLGQDFRHRRRQPTASGARAPKPSLAATLLIFLFAYLNLNRWHVRASHVAIGWLVFLVALVGARRSSMRRSPPASRAFRSPRSPPSALSSSSTCRPTAMIAR